MTDIKSNAIHISGNISDDKPSISRFSDIADDKSNVIRIQVTLAAYKTKNVTASELVIDEKPGNKIDDKLNVAFSKSRLTPNQASHAHRAM